MSKRLSSYLNSDYVSAANVLNGHKARRRIVAYVESYDDIFFWKSILSLVETDSIYFQVMLPNRGRKLERGKKAVLMSVFRETVGPDMIACVDADYDWLKQGTGVMSRDICTNPYIFHTYAYAIENLQCWAPALKEVCVMATLNDQADIPDFEKTIQSFSKNIYPLFLWHILSERSKNYGDFSMSDFLTAIQSDNAIKQRLAKLEAVSNHKADKALKLLDEELKQMGVFPEETYLYIHGHTLFDKIIEPKLTKVCNRLISQREQEIRYQSRHQTQAENEISCYRHSLIPVNIALKKNTSYLYSNTVKRILADIRKVIG